MTAAMNKQSWIARLTEEFPLAALDKVARRGYMRMVLGFPFINPEVDGTLVQSAISHLGDRLAHTMNSWPFLGGQYIEDGGCVGGGGGFGILGERMLAARSQVRMESNIQIKSYYSLRSFSEVRKNNAFIVESYFLRCQPPWMPLYPLKDDNR